jgi:predicted phosphodiesterase
MAKTKAKTPLPDAVPVAIITADLHLTETPWKHRPAIKDDAMTALRSIRRVCRGFRDEGYMDLIVAGDILDSKTPTRWDLSLMPQLYLGYRYVLGNHDVDKPSYPELFHSGNSASLHDWLVDCCHESLTTLHGSRQHIADEKPLTCDFAKEVNGTPLLQWREILQQTNRFDPQFSLLDKPIFGINYCNSKAALEKAIAELEEAATEKKPDILESSVLVLHQNCDKLFPLGEPELVDGMLPDFRLVICGHYHKPLFNTILSKTGKPIPILSPGSVYPTDIADTEPKYVYLLVSTGELIAIPLDTRKIFTFETKGETAAAKLTKTFNTTIKEYCKEYKRVIADHSQLYPLLHVKYGEEFQTLFDTVVTPTVQALFEDDKYDDIHNDFFFYTMIRSGQEAVTSDIDPTISLTTNFDSIRSTFKELEPDEEVRQLVETMFTADSTLETYQQLKTLNA